MDGADVLRRRTHEPGNESYMGHQICHSVRLSVLTSVRFNAYKPSSL